MYVWYVQLNSTYLLTYLLTYILNSDFFCLTENWIKPVITTSKLLICTPPYYAFSTARNDSSKTSSSGGGTGFLIRGPFSQLRMPSFSSFESSAITLQFSSSTISVFNNYRPLPISTFFKPYSVFLEDFSSFFLSMVATTSHEFLSPATLTSILIIPFSLSVVSLVFSFNCA